MRLKIIVRFTTNIALHMGMACIGVGSLSVSPSPSQCLLPFTYYYYYHSSLTLNCSRNSRRIGRRFGSVRAESMATDSEKLGIKIERNPPESKLTQFGVRKWPKYVPFSLFLLISLFFFLASLSCICRSFGFGFGFGFGLENHWINFASTRGKNVFVFVFNNGERK